MMDIMHQRQISIQHYVNFSYYKFLIIHIILWNEELLLLDICSLVAEENVYY